MADLDSDGLRVWHAPDGTVMVDLPSLAAAVVAVGKSTGWNPGEAAAIGATIRAADAEATADWLAHVATHHIDHRPTALALLKVASTLAAAAGLTVPPTTMN